MPVSHRREPTLKWLYFRKRFHPKILNGTKTMTLRNERITPGTLVACPVGIIMITGAAERTPRDVAGSHWREEGTDSPRDFLREIRDIHPGVNLDEPKWLHQFHLVLPIKKAIQMFEANPYA